MDIALRVVAGVLVDGFNVSPNNALGDGVDGPDVPYLAGFPYLAAPHSGFDRIHANAASLQNGRFTTTVTWTTAGRQPRGPARPSASPATRRASGSSRPTTSS